MPVDLRGLRIFVATPGGLDAERREFRRLLLRFNEDDAHERGTTFIPVGWELTLAGVGRPQELINDEVRRSDYLVLVLWDRWGTPPAVDGPFTSGTEEEYNVARACLESPAAAMRDIVVLFKGVDARQLSDPGDQLKKVLAFKRRLEEEKTLLFSTFDSLDEFQRHLTRHLLRWIRDEAAEKQPRKGPAPSTAFADAPSVEVSETSKDVADLLVRAARLVEEGRFAEAESLYAKAVVTRTDPEAMKQYTRFLRRTGRLDHAFATGERLLSIGNELDDRGAVTEALSNLAIINQKQGESRAAREYLDQAIDVAKSRGAAGLEDLAYLYDHLGTTLRKEGKLASAIRMAELALKIRDDLGDASGLANTYNTLGTLHRQRGELSKAEEMQQEALRLFVETDDRRGVARAHAQLGETLYAQGQLDAAEAEFKSSLSLNEVLGSDEGVGMNSWQLGRVELKKGNFERAEALARHALEVDEASGKREGVAGDLHLIGQIALKQSRLSEAEEAFARSLHIYTRITNRLGEGWTAADLATTRARAGDIDGARAALSRAGAAARDVEHTDLDNAVRAAQAEISQLEREANRREA
jgi:tetratricopeptide (TPR) repeat protein